MCTLYLAGHWSQATTHPAPTICMPLALATTTHSTSPTTCHPFATCYYHPQVETGSIVAAGAVVAPGSTVRSGEIWAGSPAKKLRELRPAEADYLQVGMVGLFCTLVTRRFATGEPHGTGARAWE